MFYKVTLERLVTVLPEKLDSTLNRHLLNYLREAVVGQLMPTPVSTNTVQQDYRSASKSSAIVLAVLDIHDLQDLQGKVLDNGSVSFLLKYSALVLKLHRGEVLDVVVEQIAAEGWWGNVFGAGKVFVSQSQMSLDPSRPEWVLEGGAADRSWLSVDATRSIKVNDVVRIRVLGETPQSSHAMITGTMVGPYLGPA